MPLIEINRGVLISVNNSNKMLESSVWRKLAGIVAFFQLTFFFLTTLLLVSAAFIQIYTGVAPYQREFFRKLINQSISSELALNLIGIYAIRSGILVTTIHRDIMEAYSFGIFGPNETIVEETIQSGTVLEGVSISNDLKMVLEDADWGTMLSIYVLSALICVNQCWRGAQLLRASWKWQYPTRAMTLMKCWRNSMLAFRNYFVGFLLGTLLFATDISGIIVLIMAGFWLTLCLISLTAQGYYKELSFAVLNIDEEKGI